MANYAVTLTRTASAVASLGSIAASVGTPRRAKWYDLIFGSQAAAADNPFLYVLQRFTAPGTSTAVTPQPLDPADAAATAAAGQNHTVEPTYTAGQILLEIALNQRATFRWVATERGGLVAPASASNGIGIATPTSSAVAITGQVFVEEQ